MPRVFIAISLPLDFQSCLAQFTGTLQTLIPSWRWIKPIDVHLTLRFLGHVPPDRVKPIRHALERSTQNQPPFVLSACSLECFPNYARPRVLWLGLDDPLQTLERLHTQLDTALAACGLARDERLFHPHLTIARARNGAVYRNLVAVLQHYRHQHVGDFLVSQLHLFQSQLHSEGPIYAILHSVKLQS